MKLYQAIKAKHTNGMMKAIDIPELSAIAPMSGGQKAPPATAITKKEEPFFVSEPRSLMPRAKIVGNITDIKKYVLNKAITEVQPRPISTTPVRIVLAIA